MNSSRHGGFISVFVEASCSPTKDAWQDTNRAKEVLKQWSRWREPGGAVEIIRDNGWHHTPGRSVWIFEVVWYDQDRANATLFKLTYGGQNPLVD